MKLQSSLLILGLVTNLAYGLDTSTAKSKLKSGDSLDSDKLKKELVGNNPTFSTTSTDQEKTDENIKKTQEKFEDKTIGHILSLDECGKKYSVEEIQNCRKKLFGIKK